MSNTQDTVKAAEAEYRQSLKALRSIEPDEPSEGFPWGESWEKHYRACAEAYGKWQDLKMGKDAA